MPSCKILYVVIPFLLPHFRRMFVQYVWDPWSLAMAMRFSLQNAPTHFIFPVLHLMWSMEDRVVPFAAQIGKRSPFRTLLPIILMAEIGRSTHPGFQKVPWCSLWDTSLREWTLTEMFLPCFMLWNLMSLLMMMKFQSAHPIPPPTDHPISSSTATIELWKLRHILRFLLFRRKNPMMISLFLFIWRLHQQQQLRDHVLRWNLLPHELQLISSLYLISAVAWLAPSSLCSNELWGLWFKT